MTADEWLEFCLAEFVKAVPEIRDHPALFGYFSLDEPTTSQDAKAMKRVMEVVRKHDP